LPFWGPIIFLVNLRLRWGLKQSCKFFNNMWHTSYTHIIQGNSWLLMVESQIDILTLGFFFDHNLCYKYSSGSYKPILNIYIFKENQWYKKFLNPMSFDLSNCFLKIRDSIKTLTSKVGTTWKCVCSFPHTLSHSWECECDYWVAFSACTFPCRCLGGQPKARVVTKTLNQIYKIKLINDL